MPSAVLLKAVVVWLAILGLAVVNGGVRERVLLPALGAPAAFVASGVALSCLVLVVALLGTPWYGRLDAGAYWRIGALWLALTLLFEFGFGRYVQHQRWPELLQAYTFRDGNVWPLVLVVTLVAPWLAARVRGLI